MSTPSPHRLTGQHIVAPRLMRTCVKNHPVNSTQELRVSRGLKHKRSLVPSTIRRTRRESLRLDHVVALPVWARPGIPIKRLYRLVNLFRDEPEFRHDPVDMPCAVARIERPAVRFARELKPRRVQFLMHDFKENITVQFAYRQFIIVLEFLLVRFGRGGCGLKAAKNRQKRQRIISSAGFKFLSHFRRPGWSACFVGIKKHELHRFTDVAPEIFFHIADNAVKMKLDGLRIHLIAFKAEYFPLVRLSERPHRNVL